MSADWFSQIAFRCRLEWGRDGAKRAAARGDLLVVVDTLRFSTTAVTAVHHGGVLYPCLETEDIVSFAERVGAEPGGRMNGREPRYTLSPLSFLSIEPGTKVALASPNGATCARYAAQVPYLFIGTLVNARAVANAVSTVLECTDAGVTVLACGERRQSPSEDGDLRFAVEDYLGAGAILAGIDAMKSPEAQACEAAFRGMREGLEDALLNCGSGIELQAKGRIEDVVFAAQLNVFDVVPVMRDGCLVPYRPEI